MKVYTFKIDAYLTVEAENEEDARDAVATEYLRLFKHGVILGETSMTVGGDDPELTDTEDLDE